MAKFHLFALALLFSTSTAQALPAVKCESNDQKVSIKITAAPTTTATLSYPIGANTWGSEIKDVKVTTENDEYRFSGEKSYFRDRVEQHENMNVTISAATLRGTGRWSGGDVPKLPELACVMEPISPEDSTTIESLLIESACKGELAKVRAYIRVPGIDINFVGNSGDTALLCAARNRNFESVRALLDAGATKTIRSTKDSKALIHFKLPMDLENRLYAELTVDEILLKDAEGKSIFHYNWELPLYQKALEKIPLDRVLTLDGKGNSPIDYAKGDWLGWLLEHTGDKPISDEHLPILRGYINENGFDEKRAERMLETRPLDRKKILECDSTRLLERFIKNANTTWGQKVLDVCEIHGYRDLLKEDGYPKFERSEYMLPTSLGIRSKSFCHYVVGSQIHSSDVSKIYETMRNLGINDPACDRVFSLLKNPYRRHLESSFEIIPVDLGPVGSNGRESYVYTRFESNNSGSGEFYRGLLKIDQEGNASFDRDVLIRTETFDCRKTANQTTQDYGLQLIRHFFRNCKDSPGVFATRDQRRALFNPSHYWNNQLSVIPGTHYYLDEKGNIYDYTKPIASSFVMTIPDPTIGDSQYNHLLYYSQDDGFTPFRKRLFRVRLDVAKSEGTDVKTYLRKAWLEEMAWRNEHLEVIGAVRLENIEANGYSPLSFEFGEDSDELIFRLGGFKPTYISVRLGDPVNPPMVDLQTTPNRFHFTNLKESLDKEAIDANFGKGLWTWDERLLRDVPRYIEESNRDWPKSDPFFVFSLGLKDGKERIRIRGIRGLGHIGDSQY